jgi:CBS domain-containing protein
MLLKDVMNTEVARIHPDKTVKYAGQILKAVNIGCVVVVEGDKIVGILTERDIVQKVVTAGLDPDSTRVRDIMSRQVITMNEDESISSAVECMEKHNIKKIPVANDGKVIGMVTMTDLLKLLEKK